MRLLIAEDDVVSSRVVTGLVDSWGYESTAVNDGEAALKILREENPPDMALLDWVLAYQTLISSVLHKFASGRLRET